MIVKKSSRLHGLALCKQKSQTILLTKHVQEAHDGLPDPVQVQLLGYTIVNFEAGNGSTTETLGENWS